MVKSRSSLIEQKVFVALLKAVNICTITILGIMIVTHSVHHTLLHSVPLAHSLTIGQCSWKKREEADYKLSVNAVSFFLIVDDYA